MMAKFSLKEFSACHGLSFLFVVLGATGHRPRVVCVPRFYQ
jgi:hypothetical protein